MGYAVQTHRRANFNSFFNSSQTLTQVAERCGHLPLALAIAGSMPVVKGKGLTPVPWEELIKTFENLAKMMRARGEQLSSLNTVLEASFDALAERKQEEVLKTAVLAAGAVAPIEMLLNLWEIQVRCSHHVVIASTIFADRVPVGWTDAFRCYGIDGFCRLTSLHTFPGVLFAGHGGYPRGS